MSSSDFSFWGLWIATDRGKRPKPLFYELLSAEKKEKEKNQLKILTRTRRAKRKLVESHWSMIFNPWEKNVAIIKMKKCLLSARHIHSSWNKSGIHVVIKFISWFSAFMTPKKINKYFIAHFACSFAFHTRHLSWFLCFLKNHSKVRKKNVALKIHSANKRPKVIVACLLEDVWVFTLWKTLNDVMIHKKNFMSK